MATKRVLPKVQYASLTLALAKLVRFLCNDLAGQTGPAWKVVEAYSTDSADKRRVPTGGDESNLDNAAFSAGGDFSWQTDSLAVGDWIVLRSAHASNHFQLYLRLASTTSVEVFLFPLADFPTGGADASPPDFGTAKKVGSDASTAIALTGYAGAAFYSVVADEEMAFFLIDNDATPYALYVGQIDGARSFMTPADDRPYVIYAAPATVFWDANTNWKRLSPVDDATVLTSGYAFAYGAAGVNPLTTAAMDGLGSAYGKLPICLFFYDANNKHVAGWLRYLGGIHLSAGAAGTLNTKGEAYRNSDAASSGGFCFSWDGATAY